MKRAESNEWRWIAFVLVWLAPTSLWAFCYQPHIRLDDEFFVSDVVFTGSIMADRKVGVTKEGYYEGHLFTWNVDSVLRGPLKAGQTLITSSGNDSGRFPIEAEEGHQVGRTFLIFASHRRSTDDKGVYAVDNCGNSTPLSHAGREINEIEDLPNRHGGLLYGSMMDGDARVAITARGQSRSFTTLTGNRGTFQLKVPPGQYTVTATKAGHNYGDTDIAYKASASIVVPAGGSAGLSFRERDR